MNHFVRTYTSVVYAEPQEELFDLFGDVYQASWSDIQHCSPLDKKSKLTYAQVRKVAGMTRAPAAKGYSKSTIKRIIGHVHQGH